MQKCTFFRNSMLTILLCFLFAGTNAQEKETASSSHYLFPEFIKGTVLMKSGIRHVAMLNYNMLTEEMIFDQNGTKLALDLSDPIDTVYIQARKFVLLKNTFVELLYDSNLSLYVENKCKLEDPGTPAAYGGTSQTSSTTSYSTYYSKGQVYQLKLPEGNATKPFLEYWLKKDKKLTKFFSINQLAKLNKDKKDLLNEYLEKHDVKYEDQSSIVALIRYLDSN